ncbi:MAG: S66 peptidase family protein [Flavobacteriales bacterium]
MSFPCQLPKALQPGDGVLLAAPARFVTAEQVAAAEAHVRAAGYTPMVYDGLLERAGQFGGSDAHRSSYLNAGFADEQVRAIWAMRGGYGCGRLLPLLDANAFAADPTWLVGFSDITALHGWAQVHGIASLHAPVASTYVLASESIRQGMWQALEQKEDRREPDDPAVVGGNLSVLYSLLGTPYFPPNEGAWLLLEDLDEYLYHVDRMLLAFRLAGVFDRIRGVLVGGFTDLHDNTIADGQAVDNPFGQDVRQMLAEHVPAATPVVYGISVGHLAENESVILGVASAKTAHWTRGF